MMNNSTIEALKAMRFSAMAAEFERQLDDPAAYSHLGFEERFALMVDAEWNRRQQNRLARCIWEAHFAAPGAMIEDIEYHEDRRLDKSQILRFATCKYIEDGHHIIFKGSFRQRKDLFGLRPRKRGLPQIQVCALYPSSGTAGGIEPGAGKRRAEKVD